MHFAEEWNELHHLMIMEALGGDQLWVDRFMAQHAAVFYYWVLVGFFAFSPSLAYMFSEMVEVPALLRVPALHLSNCNMLASGGMHAKCCVASSQLHLGIQVAMVHLVPAGRMG